LPVLSPEQTTVGFTSSQDRNVSVRILNIFKNPLTVFGNGRKKVALSMRTELPARVMLQTANAHLAHSVSVGDGRVKPVLRRQKNLARVARSDFFLPKNRPGIVRGIFLSPQRRCNPCSRFFGSQKSMCTACIPFFCVRKTRSALAAAFFAPKNSLARLAAPFFGPPKVIAAPAPAFLAPKKRPATRSKPLT